MHTDNESKVGRWYSIQITASLSGGSSKTVTYYIFIEKKVINKMLPPEVIEENRPLEEDEPEA